MEMVETMGEDGEGADGDGDGAVWEDNAYVQSSFGLWVQLPAVCHAICELT